MLVALSSVVLLAPARAACPADPVTLSAELDQALVTYAAFDVPGFIARASEIDADLGCLTEAVDPPTASRVHLVRGLQAWIAKDTDTMLGSFRGVVASNPTFQPPADIAPPGSRVRAVLDTAAQGGADDTRALKVQPGVVVVVDGTRGTGAIPTERAALVQVQHAGGAFRNWYLPGGDPPVELVQDVEGIAFEVAPPKAPSRHLSRTLLVAGIAGAVASGVSLGVAYDAHERYPEIETASKAEAAYTLNHVFGYGGYGLGVAAVGLGVGAFVVGEW